MGTPRAQREQRLLDAITQVVAVHGYQETTVAQITARAEVTRRGFYELFENKECCFLAAQRPLAARLIGEVQRAAASNAPSEAASSAITALVGFAEREPAAFELLVHEALAAGERAWHEREAMMERLAEAIERVQHQAPQGAVAPDVPAAIVIGAVTGALGVHMRRGEHPEPLLCDLQEGRACYAAPEGTHRWGQLRACGALCDTDGERVSGPAPPQPLPRGRHRRPATVVKSVQRERLLHGAAAAVRDKGSTEVSVAEIVAAAGLSREVFYAHFHHKQDALLATQHLGFEQLMAACASAFFTPGNSWPERVWQAGSAFTGFVVAHPGASRIGFVEKHALGRAGARRADEFVMAFTVFLREAQHQSESPGNISEVLCEAIGAVIMEIVGAHIRRGRAGELPGLLPVIAYTVLTPFLGRQAADEFVVGKLRELGVSESFADGDYVAA
jgi:AcrR family transcriptional regulator